MRHRGRRTMAGSVAIAVAGPSARALGYRSCLDDRQVLDAGGPCNGRRAAAWVGADGAVCRPGAVRGPGRRGERPPVFERGPTGAVDAPAAGPALGVALPFAQAASLSRMTLMSAWHAPRSLWRAITYSILRAALGSVKARRSATPASRLRP